MVPDKFNMVDMGGIDLIMMQGEEVPGLYMRLVESIAQCSYQCLYNWSFNGVVIPPTYVIMEVNENDEVAINEGVTVSPDDVLHIYSIEPPPYDPEIIPLLAEENGTYIAPSGVDGYSPVTVEVPSGPLEEKTVYWQGSPIEVLPSSGYYGLSKVIVVGRTKIPLIPVMTSDTTPSGIASASSFLMSGFNPYMAFNGTMASSSMQNGWLAAASDSNPYIQYEFSGSHTLDIIDIWTANNSTSTNRNVYIEGRANGTWENCLLNGDTVTLAFTAGTSGESSVLFSFDLNGNVYDAIRIRGSLPFYGGPNQYACTFSEMQVYEYQ